jgi:hypothetical protein
MCLIHSACHAGGEYKIISRVIQLAGEQRSKGLIAWQLLLLLLASVHRLSFFSSVYFYISRDVSLSLWKCISGGGAQHEVCGVFYDYYYTSHDECRCSYHTPRAADPRGSCRDEIIIIWASEVPRTLN